MAALIIESKDPKNLKLLTELAKKMGDKVQAISIEDMEDLIFGQMMDKEKTGKTVSGTDVMKKLESK
ncbi:MAG: hypothetical protein WBP45_10460 [Daejeonella sp.]